MNDELVPGSDDAPEIQRALVELRTFAAAAPAYDVAAGEQRYRATLDALPDPPGGGASSATWWLGGAIAAGLVAGVIALASSREPSAAAAPIETASVPTPIAEPVRVAIPEAPTPTAIAAVAPAPAPVVPPRATKPTRRPSAEPVATPVVAPEAPSEIVLVRRLRSAIDRDPAEALRLVAQLDEHHPQGLLLEERAALEVFALDAAGRDAGARTAARRFAAAHPGSAFATRIAAIAGREDSAAAVQEGQ